LFIYQLFCGYCRLDFNFINSLKNQGIKVCHSEEANPEIYCLVYDNRPTKNLMFPKPQSVFLTLHAGTDFQCRVETEDSSVAVVSIDILAKYSLFNH
jgi:hypothetical protein